MIKSIFSAFLLNAVFCFLIFSNPVNGASSTNLDDSNRDETAVSSEKPVDKVSFANPAVKRFEDGCSDNNLDSKKLSNEIPAEDRVLFCEALQKVSDELNSVNWSNSLRKELEQIWDVFQTQDVKIQPMKKGVSKRIAASAQAFLPDSKAGHFNAVLYLRPESAKSGSFFMFSMHELRHVYDFYRVWQTQQGITKAELEKRGFRIMGRIARETPRKESFWQLPKLWDDDWKNLNEGQIRQRMEKKIVSYMAKSKFYRKLIDNPYREFIGRRNAAASSTVSNAAVEKVLGKGARLPYLVRTSQSKAKIAQGVQEISFEIQKALNVKDPKEILAAALRNEKSLYYKMDNFVYDQKLDLRCWKKQKVTENYIETRQVARTVSGKSLFENENVVFTAKKKKVKEPSCLVNIDSIDTDATETFWSAPYLDEMRIKFVHFTEVDGIGVARYTVYKPTMQKYKELAAKYPFINPFRVFFGSIFVSVEDAQIVKFWGSSFPQAETTGRSSDNVMASYNATAVREKLESGLWVTTKLDTVAVANKRGKMKPFSYVVNYQNYRQATSDVLILDDDDSVARLKN